MDGQDGVGEIFLSTDPAEWARRQPELLAERDRLYEAYVKPLEREHGGEYAVVAPDGRMVINADEFAAVEQAVATIGRGHFLFKIGDRVLGTIR